MPDCKKCGCAEPPYISQIGQNFAQLSVIFSLKCPNPECNHAGHVSLEGCLTGFHYDSLCLGNRPHAFILSEATPIPDISNPGNFFGVTVLCLCAHCGYNTHATVAPPRSAPEVTSTQTATVGNIIT